jgi:predicted small lipoprotein YifL
MYMLFVYIPINESMYYVVLLSLWAHIIEVNNMGLIFCGLWGPIYIPQLDLPTTQLNWSVGFFYD